MESFKRGPHLDLPYAKSWTAGKDEVRAFRIVAHKHVDTAMSGEGARLFGGRWNSPGKAMVYLAGSRALAALELLVHLPTPETRRIPRTIMMVSIPKSIIGNRLWTTGGWKNHPPTRESTAQGDDWLDSQTTAAITAPSVIIPREDNYLINPLHPDAQKIEILQMEDFFFDTRFSPI